jgi:hypothetical protein
VSEIMCGCARQRCAGRAWLRLELIIIVQRSNEERGARKEVRVLREKENGHEGGKRCACGREVEGGNGRESLKKSEWWLTGAQTLAPRSGSEHSSRVFESSCHGVPLFWPGSGSSRVQRSTVM